MRNKNTRTNQWESTLAIYKLYNDLFQDVPFLQRNIRQFHKWKPQQNSASLFKKYVNRAHLNKPMTTSSSAELMVQESWLACSAILWVCVPTSKYSWFHEKLRCWIAGSSRFLVNARLILGSNFCFYLIVYYTWSKREYQLLPYLSFQLSSQTASLKTRVYFVNIL